MIIDKHMAVKREQSSPLKKISLRKALNLQDYRDFIEGNSSLKTSLEYLQKNDTYIMYKGEEAIGGFVYATHRPMKSVEAIQNAAIKEKVYQKLEGKKVVEISSLWLKQEYRKSYLSKMLWLSIAIKTFWGEGDYYLFGTTHPKLRKTMDYPACTFEFLTADIKKIHAYKEGYYFLAEKKHTLWGMLQAVFYLTFKPAFKPQKKHVLHPFQISQESEH